MKKFALCGSAMLLASSFAMAQTPYADDSVYRGLGGEEGIRNIVENFMSIVLADPRIKDGFADFDIPELKKRLGEQFCEFAGGPCKYTGKYKDRDMKSVHE